MIVIFALKNIIKLKEAKSYVVVDMNHAEHVLKNILLIE
jgi:hypothetical protein